MHFGVTCLHNSQFITKTKKRLANVNCFATFHMSLNFMFSTRQCSDIAVITTLHDTTSSVKPTTTEQTTTTCATTTKQPTTTEEATTTTDVTTAPST